MPYALASEYPRLTEAQKAQVTHLIPDDGNWTPEQIAEYIFQPLEPKHEDDWTKP